MKERRCNPVGPTFSYDGMHVEVAASVDDAAGVRRALELGAGSIGLLRAEGLYNAPALPTEEELFLFYRDALESAGGARVIARVCDLGGDNRPASLCLPQESNPAMGYRSIRLLLSRPEFFLTHLRALLRASHYGRLAILLPMVSTVDEVLRTRQLLEEARAQLATAGVPVAHELELGVMVENPAAAIISDLLVRYVDFFCLGTHTLTQFTLATDRNSMLYSSLEARTISVLRFIRRALDSAREAGIWTSVIGHSAADAALVPPLLALGVSVLSVEPEQLEATRGIVRATNVSVVQKQLLAQLATSSGQDMFSSKI